MATSNRVMIHKLQEAINQHGGRILYEKSQFYSEQENRPITLYRIAQSPGKGMKKEKLFETTSMIQVVLYLRDVWYTISNQEIPTDNEQWEEIKKKQNIDYRRVKLDGKMGNK